MQYLLTEEEMAEINRRAREQSDLPSRDRLVAAVQNIACNAVGLAPDSDWNARRGPSERPHGCIHVEPKEPRLTTRYCDFCPVTKICPQPKNWSK